MTKTLIHAGTLITASDDRQILRNQGVLIEDGIIQSVDSWNQFVPDETYLVIDASQYVLLPGLIDAHTHVTMSGDPKDKLQFLGVTETDATTALKSVAHARDHLCMGVTTIRDLGAPGWIDIALRDAVNAGWFPGPRIVAAGRGITCSLGHMDPHKAFRPDVVVRNIGIGLIADSPDEARKAAWENLMRGSDVLKLNATMSTYLPGIDRILNYPELPFESMKAICEVAHGAGRRVAAHCHGGPGIDMAIDAGVDTFEHGRFLTDPQLERMAELGRFLVPTLSPEARMADTNYLPENSAENPFASRWIEIATEVMYDTVSRAHGHGVRIAAGTDVGMPNIDHGEVAYEMYHLSLAGLSNLSAIASATREAASACDLGDILGQVRPGYIADLLIVDGDPSQDLQVLRQQESIYMVIQGGQIAVDRNGSRHKASIAPESAALAF